MAKDTFDKYEATKIVAEITDGKYIHINADENTRYTYEDIEALANMINKIKSKEKNK